jgi:hypothetical protein
MFAEPSVLARNAAEKKFEKSISFTPSENEKPETSGFTEVIGMLAGSGDESSNVPVIDIEVVYGVPMGLTSVKLFPAYE